MLLISPNLGISHPPGYSNGNCELAIVDVAQLNTTFISVYRPPPPNASLSKFKDVLNRIRQHTEQNKTAGKDFSIILSGDFNFPPTVVNWIESEGSVFADPARGTSVEKVAFQLLHDLAIDLDLGSSG